MTENYAALDILGHYLKVEDESTEPQNQIAGPEKDRDDEVISKPFILFGSSFPKDREYTQVCLHGYQFRNSVQTLVKIGIRIIQSFG